MKKPNTIPRDCYLVEGGTALSGVLRPSGSKNAALPILAATLLTDKPVKLANLPHIRDVQVMLRLLASLGVEIEWEDKNSVTITAENVDPDRLDLDLCESIRASILLASPLLARSGSLILPPPGGDVIGRRRLDTHFISLENLGAKINFDKGLFNFSCSGLHGREMLLDEPSVTATENVIMAATQAEGETVIYNAACEPNVQDLICFLTSMGAHIEGSGTNRILIRGKSNLLEGTTHCITNDHIEIGSFIGLAACCRGKIVIPDVPVNIIEPIMNGFSRLGIQVEYNTSEEQSKIEKAHTDLVIPAHQKLIVQCDRGGAVPTIYDGPWPGFSPDLTSTAVVVATQANGTCLVFEKMFESRLFFVDKLVAMGARIIQCDPHRVVISGPTQLSGTDVSSPDIRAGMALLTAALCAEGTSLIRNVHQIERGYCNLVERLKLLGATIEKGESKTDQ